MRALPFTRPDERWAALIRRDPSADGAFVYAVVTTGVFCRASCASRRPLRRNVEFFDSAGDALQAGYRPCKRCAPGGRDPRDAGRALVVAACRLLEHGEAARTVDVARRLGVSPFHFQRLFKKHIGVTPQAYRRRVLANRAKESIRGAASVTAAVYEAGYSSSSRFYDGAGRELGMAPRTVRAGAEGEHVRYVTRPCSLGRILLAWTDRGACDVQFGETEEALVSRIQGRFPRATLERDRAPSWVDHVVEAVEMPRPLDIPLDIEGTAFQQRVWQELRRIPAGETRTYSQVAAAIGAPRSTRAVARACASNHLAVVVPCHRVIRSDGDPSGYRWGAERKEALLRREAQFPRGARRR